MPHFRPFAWLRQAAAITLTSLRGVGQRLGSSLVAVVGVAGVVLVFVAVLSIAEGFARTLERTGSPDTAIVLRSGSPDEMSSGLSRDDARVIAEKPGILRTADGPAASAELFVIVDLPLRATGTLANVPLRGVEPAAFAVRDEVRIVEGRGFEPGRTEVIVGSGAAASFGGLEVGNTLRWGENEWRVVGRFEAGGTAPDSEIWTDARVLQPAYRRGDSFQSVWARLESPEAFDAFAAALEADPRVNVRALRETEFYAQQSRLLTGLIRGLGFLIAGLMGVGAVFAAVNTLYTAVAARSREIATLRALGFAPGAVVVSVLVEAALLALVGGVLGGVIAWAVFDGFHASTMNWASFAQITFAFAVTPRLLLQGISYALVIGLLGGLLPALRAARLPVATALREA
ncbi:MAG TPA: ABC transporter permease [Thermoanaerobaculia bacterium]|nr:ABC transporter permease [Thermoanaerobaculia bacterium]